VLFVDEDVDIYSPHDLLWAIITRWDAGKGMMRPPARSSAYAGVYASSSGVGIDATVPWGEKDLFERAHYPVEIDLGKWIPENRIAGLKMMQSDYAKLLGATGH
jgi:3-polyprenyl-4-hydroxybenzoate decarboxylase